MTAFPGKCHYRHNCWLGDVCRTQTENHEPRPLCFRPGMDTVPVKQPTTIQQSSPPQGELF
jgi:hypothetical protein